MGFSGFSSLDYMKPDILTTVRSTAQEFLDKSKRQLGDETAEVLIKEGDAADCIKEAATEQKADIIVMGSHSRKWLDSILMGSTVARVLHETAVPLYIFPTRKHN
jgi:nucleotide-binding universal stress UspA family protein